MNTLTNSVKTLVVDDTAFMRKALVKILEADSDIEVVGVAKNGKDALDAIRHLDPQVVTMDIDMPVMDGLTAMKHIMIETPTPVVMVSSLAEQGAITLDALRLGAVDFFPKPSGTISLDIESQGDNLKDIIKTASKINPSTIRRVRLYQDRTIASTLIKQLDASLGIVIVITPKGFSGYLLRLLVNLRRDLPVSILALHDISKKVIRSCTEEFNSFVHWNVVSDGTGLLRPGECIFHAFNDLYSLDQDVDGHINITGAFEGNVSSFIDKTVNDLGEKCLVVFFGDDPASDMKIINEMNHPGSNIIFCYGNLAERGLMNLGISSGHDNIISEYALWSAIETFGHELLLDYLTKGKKNFI